MFQRTVTLRNRTGVAGDVYLQVSGALREALAAILPACTAALATWPNCEWNLDRAALRTSEWTAANAQSRLLTVAVQLEKLGRLWSLELLVGATTAGEAAVQEVCRPDPAPAQFPLHELPNLLACCEHFACYDVDGMRTGAAYLVQKTRAAELRTFLQRPSAERRLPIVLVTPNPDRTFPLDYRKLAQLLCGAAHVMVLNPANYWKNADISAVHGCLGGAVRLFRPGYAVRDAAAVHPCFQPHAGQIAGQDKLELLDKIVAFLAATADDDPLFAQLARRQQEEQAEREVQQRLHAWQEQAAQDQQQSRLNDEFLADFERTLAELDVRNRELAASQAEVRRLNYVIQQLRNPAETLAAAESCDEPYVTLSDRAADTLQGLDAGERELITSTLLRKLASDPLRKNQSEVCPLGEQGTFYVYPRKKTNGGRRIVYLLHGPEVRVCEIYASHDTYQHERKKGWSEADYQDTRIWFDEGEGSTQLEMALQP